MAIYSRATGAAAEAVRSRPYVAVYGASAPRTAKFPARRYDLSSGCRFFVLLVGIAVLGEHLLEPADFARAAHEWLERAMFAGYDLYDWQHFDAHLFTSGLFAVNSSS